MFAFGAVSGSEGVFEIVNQFNRGHASIAERAERELVAELNAMAGLRAKASSAYASAQGYFAMGSALLGEDGWESQHDLSFKLALNGCECSIVNSEMEAAEAQIASILQRPLSITEEAQATCLSVLLQFTLGRSENAVEVALRFLNKVGFDWSHHPTEQDVRVEYDTMRSKLIREPARTLLERPPMAEPKCIATMSVLTELFPAAYAVDRYPARTRPFAYDEHEPGPRCLRRFERRLRRAEHGIGSALLGSRHRVRVGQDRTPHRGAKKRGSVQARVYSCFAAFTMPWMMPLQACEPLMRRAFEIGSSMGDVAFAAYNQRNLVTHLLVSGAPLEAVQREAEQAFAFASRIQLGLHPTQFVRQLHLVKRLRGVPVEDSASDAEWSSRGPEEPPGIAMMICYYWVFSLQESVFFSDIPAAVGAAERIGECAGPCGPPSKRPSTTSTPPWPTRLR